MRRILALILVFAAARAVRAGDPPRPGGWPADAQYVAPVSDETRALVRDLGSEDFATRERASRALAQHGAAAFTGLRLLVAATDDPEVQARTGDAMAADELREAAGASAAARLAIADGDLQDAQLILQIVLPTSRPARMDFAALRALRAGKGFDPAAEVAALGRMNLSEEARNETAMYLFRAAGDHGRAGTSAAALLQRDAVPSPLLASMLLEARDYAALGGMPAPPPPAADSVLLPLLQGQQRLAEAAYQAYWQPRRPLSFADMEFSLAAGHGDDLLAALKAGKRFEEAFTLLACQGRLREAMALPLEDSAGPARLLLSLGFRGHARRLLLTLPPAGAPDAARAAESDIAYAAALHGAGLDDLARKYEGLAWEVGNGVVVDVQPLVPEMPRLLDVQFWRIFSPEETDQARFEQARAVVFNGARPAMYPDLLPRVLQYLAAQPDISSRRLALLHSFNALEHAGEAAAAEKLVRDYAGNSDPDAMILPADWALEHDRPAEALAVYLKLAPVYHADASLMYATGLAMSRVPASRAAGEELMAYAPLLVLGSNSAAAHLAGTMRRFQGGDAADAWSDGWLSRFGSPATLELNNRLPRARAAAEARGDYAEALALQGQSLIRPSPLAGDGLANALLHLSLYHRLRALDALQRKDMAVLADALSRGLANGLPDADLLQKAIPPLQTANPGAAAAILKSAIDRLAPLAADCPELPKYKEALTQLQQIQQN